MNPSKRRSVYKYLELADRFVRVQVLDEGAAQLELETELDRAGYRRSVIRTCLEEFREDLPAKLDALHPGAPQSAADLLYQLCVSVNPDLEIHHVTLPDAGAPAPSQRPRRKRARTSEQRLVERLRRRARGLEERLRERIVGQDRAIDALVRSVRRGAAGLATPDRPLACCLLAGRTGTGKTELVRTFARDLFGEDALVRIDCSEFGLAHESSKLTGAPPGYVGHESGGHLTEALLENPERVVLFDEVEKAHPRLHHHLLQILEDGRLTDGKGRCARFDKSFVLMTSNAGAAELDAAGDRVGFGSAELDERETDELSRRALKACFAPEFLGRVDETILFRDLDLRDARAIAELQLRDLATLVRRRGTRVAFTGGVAQWVARRGFSLDGGARDLRRVVRNDVEAPLARYLLERDRRGGLVRAEIRGGRLRLREAD